jgi:hypothetical protein
MLKTIEDHNGSAQAEKCHTYHFNASIKDGFDPRPQTLPSPRAQIA